MATPRQRPQAAVDSSSSLTSDDTAAFRSPSATTTTATAMPPSSTTSRHPLLPTPLEVLVLAIYPLTLLAGSLFALISPAIRNAPYDAAEQAYAHDAAPSYFATKHNIFNQWFVKKGWLWITLSFVFFLATHPWHAAGPSSPATPRRRAGLLRWALITAWWIVITQWFFGPPIIDRSFVWTGGKCELVQDPESLAQTEMPHGEKVITGIACKAIGGKWKGGHDISGHVFLLVSGSMFLLEELLHIALRLPGTKEERTILTTSGQIKSAELESEGMEASNEGRGQWDIGAKVVAAVAALCWWMLLMTATFFHTWLEKLTGLVVALTGIFMIYFLPRAFPAVRAIVGMPGV